MIRRGLNGASRPARRWKPDAGFTLIEVVVVALLSAIVSGILLTFFLTFSQVFDTIQAMGTIQLDLMHTEHVISNDVRLANSMPPSCCVNPTYTADANTLILQVPSTDPANPYGLVAGKFDSIIYRLTGAPNGRMLERIVVAAAESGRATDQRVVANNLSGVGFVPNGHDLTITLQGSKQERGQTYLIPLTAHFTLRNWNAAS